MDVLGKNFEKYWSRFVEQENITEEQLSLFQKYASLILEWNQKFNITAITNLSEMITKHFSDALMLNKYMDVSKVKVVADVGSGAGIPGIPLKIAFPHLSVMLMEVNKKKVSFLKHIVNDLGLKNVEVCDVDWRTFLRTTEGEIDLFVARASLDPHELCRMFKPSSDYKDAKLVYWASQLWEPDEKIKKFILKEEEYKLGYRKLKLVFMGLK